LYELAERRVEEDGIEGVEVDLLALLFEGFALEKAVTFVESLENWGVLIIRSSSFDVIAIPVSST
jgi:hypothetical protein